MCPNRGTFGFSQGPVASESTVGDAGRGHCVFAVVDNCQAKHQSTFVETYGMLLGNLVTILFDSGALESFISSFVVMRCRLGAVRQVDRWQAELSLGVRVASYSLVLECRLEVGPPSYSIGFL